ncbi:HAUS augmin-like complex subunit 7 [Diretmus argenteus]
MAGDLKEKQLAQRIYAALQAASCPLVEGLYLQETDSMQQLLCTPSEHRTDILAWICSRYIEQMLIFASKTENFSSDKMALLGQELMLCKADDLELIRGQASPRRQLQFLEQLLTMVPGCRESAECKIDEEGLLNELHAAENLPYLRHMLSPTLDPWPAHINALCKGQKSSFHRPSTEEVADVAALLRSTESALEQLKSECEFLQGEALSPGVFSPCALRVAVCDLRQLMSAFNHLYDTDFRAYCNRDPPSLSTETHVFHRVHQLLLACNTELEMLNEVSEASVAMTDSVSQLQTQPRYWSRGEKHTLPDQLEELTRRYRDFLSPFHA